MNGNNMVGRSRRRLPSVDEALPLTPFTSIVPFDAELIPMTAACPASIQSSALDTMEIQATNAMFHRLNSNQNAVQGQTSAQLVEQALKDTRDLLDSAELTRYKFKPLAYASAEMPFRRQSHKAGQAPRIGEGLGRFANRVLNETDVSYRIPAANTPHKSQSSNHKPLLQSNGESPTRRPSPSRQPSATEQNGSALKRQSEVSAFCPCTQIRSDMKLNVDIDKASALLSDAALASTKKPMPQTQPGSAARATVPDQHDRSEAAFNTLSDLMRSIFQAEDQLEPDTSGALPDQAQQYFVAADIDGQSSFVIDPDVQTRLLNAIAKLINVRAFHRISVESLVHLQRLCQSTQAAASGIALEPPVSMDEDSLGAWKDRVDLADNNLRASRTLVKIMLGGIEDKQIYSEDIIKSMLDNLKNILENCLIPIVEARASGKLQDTSGYHTFFSDNPNLKAQIVALLRRAGGLLKALGDLILQVDISEEAIATMEALSIGILFVENASSEKDAILSISSFEDARRHGMETLAKIFLRFPDPSHRRSILNEILASLEKLPVGRQSARQYKVVGGKPIQVVSALVMLLVQISATRSPKATKSSGLDGEASSSAEDNQSDSDDPLADSNSASRRSLSKDTSNQVRTSLKQDFDVATSLFDSAKVNANYIINFLLSRAQKVSKSSDEPYRNLLDIFTEDLVGVLGNTDWPGAEILLHHLFAYLGRLVTNDKSIAPIKVMALELLGSLGSGIADLQAYVLRTIKTLEADSDSLDLSLSRLAQDFLNTGRIDTLDGGFQDVQRAVLHFVPIRDHDNLLLQSAQCFLLASWVTSLSTTNDRSTSDTELETSKHSLKANTFAKWLLEAIETPVICETESGFGKITTSQGHLAYALVVLASPFCRTFPSMIHAFVSSLRSPHATVKSRALKSVLQLLEKNPQILDTSSGMINTALAAAQDSSPSVRDSALTLLGKCITLKPSLDIEVCKHLLSNVSDPSTAVRKKQLRLFTDIYLRNEHKSMRAAIASAILMLVGDHESSVSELAKSTMEEIWMAPFQLSVVDTEPSPQAKQRLRHHAAHIVETTNSDSKMPEVLEALMRELLSEENKKAAANKSVCKAVLSTMFDSVIDNEAPGEFPGQSATLCALTVFAKASPTLFNAGDMVVLRPYIDNLASEEDRLVFRSAVIIYRCVLPVLPPLEHKFLEGVQQTLLQNVNKLGKGELNEVGPCLWMINGVLKNTARLAQFTISIFRGIDNARNTDLNAQTKESQTVKNRTQRYIRIAGPMGKAFDLEGYQTKFKEQFKSWKGVDVQELMIDILSPFLAHQQPYEIRLEALEAVSLICQAWPHIFVKQPVIAAFEKAFMDRDAKMEQTILNGILAFYETEEARSKSGSDIPVGDGTATGAERLGKSLGVAAHDSAATSLAERFLGDALRISRASLDHLALTATRVIASINRQGLVHPKQCGSALVVLETSPNPFIALEALEQHKDLHMKHESMLGKEYVHAIGQVFAYQRDTIQDASGVASDGSAKLKPFFGVLKAGSVASRKKLYTDIVKKLDFNPHKSIDKLESQLPYSRFVIENLALIEPARLDEALHLYLALEKMFLDTGNALSQLLEPVVAATVQETNDGQQDLTSPLLNGSANLRLLTIAAIILTMVSEARSYLRKTWSLPTTGASKAKLISKDASKAPSRSASSSPELLLKRIAEACASLQDYNSMVNQCKAFMDALSVDNEYKVESDDSGSLTAGEGPDVSTTYTDGSPNQKKRKSSASVTPGGRQEKKQRPSFIKRKSSKTTTYAESDEEDDGEDDWN